MRRRVWGSEGGKGRHRKSAALNGGQPDTVINGHAAHIRERWVNCNNVRCKSCPHGPYLYQVWRDDDGKLHEKYLGKGERA